jgi:hypothetical protein
MKSSHWGKFKKTLILSLIWLLVLMPRGFGWAQEVTPPPEPTPTEAAPTPVAEPSAPPSPATPTVTENLSPTPTPTTVVTEEATLPTPTPTSPPATTVEASPPPNSDESGNSNLGETVVTTEDATNSVVLVTEGNTNQSAATESASVSTTENQQTEQENQASVRTILEQETNTGSNSASSNVGESRVESGDANTSGTVITALNTNLDGVAFTEYNVTGEQTGDLVLDFSQNSLADSESALVKKVEESGSFQNNEAVLENTLVLSSDSGENQANLNTGGDSTVQTGNANTAATVLTFLNNNLAGNVSLGVVNIFGTLVGDIILPQEAMENQTSVATTEETTGSNFQNNEAVIENNLVLQADTGGNEGRDNTDGATVIETGEASADSQTINVVNNNLAGGSWWLVLINEAGEWVGKIFGAPEGASFAAAEAVEFSADENGDITIDGEESQESTATSEQTNKAQVVNNLALSASTGHNQASKNTGGDSTIKTGNARIVASLLNFVNNNVSSQSKVLVTVVNVFGRWLGNFLPPGIEKKTDSPPPPPADNNSSGNQVASESEENDSEPLADPEPTPPPQGRRLAARLAWPNQPEGQTLSIQSPVRSSFEKPLRLNLAWLAVTLPLFFLAAFLKRWIF